MNLLKKILSNEIGIDFKACLYFFCIVLYYAVFQIRKGSMEANILIMAEMIVTTYIMGYIQVYLLRNFDEGEYFGRYEFFASVVCSLFYGGVGYLGKWFDRQLCANLIFVGYLFICYVCVFLSYKIKRDIDTKEWNQDLEAFKKEKNKEEER